MKFVNQSVKFCSLILLQYLISTKAAKAVLRNEDGRSLEALQNPVRCGCQDCTSEVWNRDAPSLYGDQVYSCGERINYLIGFGGMTEEQACLQVASIEFPTICGIECNPLRCDGKSPEYTASPTVTPLDIQLEPETELYCYPSYNNRKRWTNVWEQNFIVEVKEDTIPCGPGDNFFDRSLVDIQNDELKLEFKRVKGRWTGSEVRLVLPTEDMPFRYGTYSFHIKSIQHKNGNGQTLADYLPPSLVLGLFTWDDTERYALRENFNHEVDVEISRWNFPDNTDANFLVQPPGLPQYLRFHSGGSQGSFNQTGAWEFTWLPNSLFWSTDAGPGMTHSYTTQDAQYFAIEDRVQCLPANMELRINLWNSLGSATPTEMGANDVVEVILDNVQYIPSNETFVADGGACSKNCQCAELSDCVNGICVSSGPMDPSATPVFAPSSTPVEPSTQPVGTSAACSDHGQCSHLAGDCCPTPDGTFLSCCSSPVSEPTPAPYSKPLVVPYSKACKHHDLCSNLAGDCCPTPDDVMLACCTPVEEQTGAPSPELSSFPTKDTSSSPTGSPSMTPSAPPTRRPSVSPSSIPSFRPSEKQLTAACSDHPDCAQLSGDCCPTISGTFLACCVRDEPTPPPTTNIYSGKKGCSSNPGCQALGLKGQCCPTVDGVFLHCCA